MTGAHPLHPATCGWIRKAGDVLGAHAPEQQEVSDDQFWVGTSQGPQRKCVERLAGRVGARWLWFPDQNPDSDGSDPVWWPSDAWPRGCSTRAWLRPNQGPGPARPGAPFDAATPLSVRSCRPFH
jgi:hypothetical protein